jgi:hypothetical protein
MATNGPAPAMPTTDMIAAQALDLANNMRTLAAQGVEEAARLSAFADGAANNIVEVVNRFTNQTNTLLTFIDKTTEASQVAIDSIAIFTSKLPPNPQDQVGAPRR